MHLNRKIRVLQTIHQGKVGGGERHVLDLVSCMDKSRFEPIVLSFTDGPMITALRQMQVPAYIIPTERSFDVRVWRKVRQFLIDHRIDVVHVHGSRANTNVLWMARSLGIPTIYTVHGWSFHNDLSFFTRRARMAAEQFITRRTMVNITVSEANRQTGLKAFGRFRSIVIRNGVNLGRFNPDSISGHRLRRSFGFTEDDIVIGFIVRMTLQKDPLGMIRAFALAAGQETRLKLLMVGEGELKHAAIALANDLGLEGAVIFDDFREDIPEVLKAIDIYCLPSLWEGFPIGVLEAMAMGRAIIATDVDGTREAIDDEVSGLLIPPKDTVALSAAILKLAHNNSLRARLQEAALRKVRSEYSITTMTEKVEAVYTQLYYQKKIFAST